MIFLSSGGFGNQTAVEAAALLHSQGVEAIELSGGAYSASSRQDLIDMSKNISFQVHNYFPPPQVPFVFNLASLDPKVAEQSFQHVVAAMNLSAELGRPIYSFHAGFLLDPHVKELGKRIESRKLFDRSDAMSAFIERLNRLSKIASQMNVQLLVENNVLSKNNFQNFRENPFLMADAGECAYVMERTPDNINLLVDVAHLKVSSNSLGFDPKDFLRNCDQWIKAYHLSDNDGTRDSNECFSEAAWFWPLLKNNLDYYSLEIYGASVETLLDQIRLTRKKLKV